jgi:hypothetical protein
MNKIKNSLTTVEVFPGEIVQICDNSNRKYILKFTTQGRTKTKRATLSPAAPLISSAAWPVNGKDTVATVLKRWLADIPLSSEAVGESLELSHVFGWPLASVGIETTFKLNLLKTVLDGCNVIEVESPDQAGNTGRILADFQEFTESYLAGLHVLPAFIVYDEVGLPSISFFVNRILEKGKRGIQEIVMEF